MAAAIAVSPSAPSLVGANPYAAPAAPVDVQAPLDTGLEAIRRAHIGAEANIKSIGLLNLIGGALMAFGAVFVVVAAFTATAHLAPTVLVAIAGVYGLLAGTTVYTGSLLRRLEPLGRTIATILMVLGFLGSIPGGVPTLGGGVFWAAVILLSLWSKKARVVFSDDYRTVVVPATPHVKYRTPVWVWACLGIIVLIFIAGIVAGARG